MDLPQEEIPIKEGTHVDEGPSNHIAMALLKTTNVRNFFYLLSFDEKSRITAANALAKISEHQYE